MRRLIPTLFCLTGVLGAAELPEQTLQFLADSCLDCHDADVAKGEIDLDVLEVDWTDEANLRLWERVLNALESGEMPPEHKKQPAAADREAMVAWIDQTLTENTEIGGTLARRLNRDEYRRTIESLFGISNFELPPGFPADSEHHGFDNLGEGLVLSPPLLDAYAETASLVADQLFPPERGAPEPQAWDAAARDLVISYSSAKVIDDALRLGLKCDPIQRSCTWPSKIQIEASGVYTITLQLSSFKPVDDKPMIVRVFARDIASNDGVSHKSLRQLQEVKVTSESPTGFEFEAELYEGQTIVIHWANAPLDSDRNDKAQLQAWFKKRFDEDPKYLAAWQRMVKTAKGQGFRGGVGWERVKKLLKSDDLPEVGEKERDALLKTIGGNPVLYAETVSFDVFENGPSLEVHHVSIEGPSRVVDGPLDKQREQLRARFLAGAKPEESLTVIGKFLTNAFRRPVDNETAGAYHGLYLDHLAAGHSADEATHLVIRNVLISPRFLYRSLTDGPLDDHDLATRLAYFLTGKPPDSALRGGPLTKPEILRKEAQRLMPKSRGDAMIQNFVGQWLDLRLLPEIMPDPKFKFTTTDILHAQAEAEMFFAEMLAKNRPMTDFIDPDFTFTSAKIARDVYGLKKGFNAKNKSVQRVSLQRGGRHGGLLGQSAVLMATANGVDTQPVVRGVWVLENILGMPPPPPPKSVPALTPDTTGATTPRQLLSAHTSEESCAGCHKKIDPVGFVLENFDPVGRWRDNWPGIDVPVEAAATLPDGTRIEDVTDFKAWLVENIDLFSNCLAEKLMTYATGRVPNYRERKEIEAVVERNRESGNGFRDLVLALIESETFRTK